MPSLHVARGVNKQVMCCTEVCILYSQNDGTKSTNGRSRTCNFQKLFHLLFRLGSTNIREYGVGLKVRFAQDTRTLDAAEHTTTFSSLRSFLFLKPKLCYKP
ncbi:hypothetical protein L798_07038 [Zootermopsis nevadensis]|uniref:Uncharacterized protein n=1 Tax=Zootermopsis nevadensis TaxID=136037 RepID=A0A067R6V2_ZOONE|nr:hypothetical protein L798_07038 [Zootermopsis nevadensis]